LRQVHRKQRIALPALRALRDLQHALVRVLLLDAEIRGALGECRVDSHRADRKRREREGKEQTPPKGVHHSFLSRELSRG
jgi:hypothetical protein